MFEIQNTKEIPLLRVNAQVFKHSRFGCTHLHLDCDSTEKAFSVAFRTIPKDHSGIAHILEHTVLCGSEKFLGEGLVGPLIPESYRDDVIMDPIVLKKFSGAHDLKPLKYLQSIYDHHVNL